MRIAILSTQFAHVWRGLAMPHDDLVLQFEAVSQLQPEEQSVIKNVLESLVIKYQSSRWNSVRAAPAKAARKSAAAKRAAHATHR